VTHHLAKQHKSPFQQDEYVILRAFRTHSYWYIGTGC